MTQVLQGIITPIVTPFHADETLNERGLRRLTRYVLEHRVQGVLVCGSQGEFYALDSDERRRVCDAVIEEAGGRAPVIVNTGAVTTREAVSLTRYAAEAGADAIAVITPYFVHPSPQELRRHYEAILDASTIPVLAYNNPDRTGINLTPELVGGLARHNPSLVGVKDSSGDIGQTIAYMESCPVGFRTFIGRDTLIYAGLACGCVGAVAATSNVVPELTVGIYEAFVAGNHVLAQERQRQLAPLRRAFALGTFPVVIKEALVMMGLPAGPTRAPVGPLSEQARATLSAVLHELGAVG